MGSKEKEQRTRRTVKACVICHKKKVRCDIDNVEGEVCTPCARDGYDCIPRERKRKRFTFSPSPPASQRQRQRRTSSARNLSVSVIDGSQPTFSVDSASSANPLESGLDGIPNTLFKQDTKKLKSEGDQLPRRLSQPASVRDSLPLMDQTSDYPAVHENQNEHVSPDSNLADMNYPHSSNPNIVSYLGRLEYLQNEVPINDDAGLPNKVPHRLSDSDLEILRIQRVSELPPRSVRDSLMDAFWTRCYPWTPIVERSWIENRPPDHVSLLLQQAILLAGSRVSAPMTDYPPENFYKRARILFWMGAEEDPIITIAAACLLQWWNPDGPERISLDSSNFWSRICVGLAYQIGLHREPTRKPDAGLRRRIWWSLVVRDCLINAGHGRPRSIDLKLADVSPVSAVDFEGMAGPADLFSVYAGISCILGDLTQSYLRRHGLQEHKKSLEDKLFRWVKTLPESLQLCRPIETRPLKQYNFEARQLHIQYFATLIILHRPVDPKLAPSTASLLASSFIAGIFEDFMARDELRYLGPIFTFYCLTAGMAQLSCYRYTGILELAEENLDIIRRALDELSKRWPTAVGSLKHLMDVREKVTQRSPLGHFPDINLSSTTRQFFSDFGPDLCRMWHPVFQRYSQAESIAPRELETAGILQGLRTPNDQRSIDLDLNSHAMAQQQMIGTQAAAGETPFEPTMLQPQEWFGPYGGVGNWLMVDWDQGFGW